MPKEFLHYGKSSRTKTDFPTWGPGKGPENLQGIWLWRPVGFDYRTSTGLGKQSLEGHKQNLMCTQEKGTVTPSVDWARLACECLGVSGGGMGWQWSAAGLGVLTNRVLRGLACSHKPFWRRWPYCHYPCYREGHTAPPSSKKLIKDLQAWPCPPEQGQVFPTASPFRQEASTSLLSIRGQTEWKPQSLLLTEFKLEVYTSSSPSPISPRPHSLPLWQPPLIYVLLSMSESVFVLFHLFICFFFFF